MDGEVILDLCYDEDSRAEVDFNVVMTQEGDFIEIQGAAEKAPFSRTAMNELLSVAGVASGPHLEVQRNVIGGM